MSFFEKLFAKKNQGEYTTGKKIREARNATRVSAKELGAACGVNETAIRNYEQGIRHVNQEKLELIAKHLGITPSALYDRRIDTYVDAMQILFELEDNFELLPITIPQEPQFALFTKDPVLVGAVQAWYEQRRKWERKEITLEQLKHWERSFPLQAEQEKSPHGEDEKSESVYTDFERIIALKRALEQQKLIQQNYIEQIRDCLLHRNTKMALYHLEKMESTIATIFDSDIASYG